MSTMLTVEQFPSEMALIMAHLAEQVSNASAKRKLYTCGKLFCVYAVETNGAARIVDLENYSINDIQDYIGANTCFILVKYVELEDKTDG